MVILEFSPNEISDDDRAHSVALGYKGGIFLMLDCLLRPGRDKVPFCLLLLPRASMFENNLLHSTLYKDLGEIATILLATTLRLAVTENSNSLNKDDTLGFLRRTSLLKAMW